MSILQEYGELWHRFEVEELGIFDKKECGKIKELELKLESALKLQERINQQDVSLYKEALETVEKIQFGKELDKWDSSNLQYTIEDLLKFIISQKTLKETCNCNGKHGEIVEKHEKMIKDGKQGKKIYLTKKEEGLRGKKD